MVENKTEAGPQRKPEFVDDDEKIPQDVKRLKQKLEAETGKKYRYRPAKKDLPGVGELLKESAIKDGPKTWKETVGYAVVFAFLFALSLFLFHHAVLNKPSKVARGKMKRRYRGEQEPVKVINEQEL
jgi:hypothetical protein